MAAPQVKKAIGNSASTTLSSSISNSATSAPLTSDTNFSAKSGEGMVIIDEGTASAEFSYSTGKTGSSLDIPLANRGLEGGSALAHNSGATVKGVITAGMWNDFTDSYLAEHNDAGTHKELVTLKGTSSSSAEIRLSEDTDNGTNYMGIKAPSAVTTSTTLTLPDGDGSANQVLKTDGSANLGWTDLNTVPVKASGAEVTTGTDDAKFATPKALADAGINTRLKSKIITATRDVAAASGDVAYTGVGFTPSSVHAVFCIESTTFFGVGTSDSSLTSGNVRHDSTTSSAINGDLICLTSATGGFHEAVVKSYDADGFTLTWTKTGSPTGTMKITFTCYR